MKKQTKKLIIGIALVMLMMTVLCFGASALDVYDTVPATGQCGDNVYWNYDKDSKILIISGKGDMWDYYTDPFKGTLSPFDRYLYADYFFESVIIEDGITSIGNSIFHSQNGIKNVEISESVTHIGDYAFNDCSSLETLEIPDSVTSIGAYAFSYSGLKSIKIPDSMTTVGEDAFFRCEDLSSVIIPTTVTNIESYAFGSTAITTAHYCGTQEQWNNITIDYGNTPLTKNIHMSEDKDINGICEICDYEFTHIHNYTVTATTPATCTENGYTVYTCKCTDTYTETIPTTGHDYQNAVCTKCGDSKADDCSHLCHKSGFMGFIWKIINFFSKLFKINPVCECGVAHY
ncbi:MAG: leucine-rich repeat domain-containing protein [Clostridia bacterium]|nr:leucine-rich repeat domain-containing protein [Clostridia bacterium]